MSVTRWCAAILLVAAFPIAGVAVAKPDLDKGPHYTAIEKQYLTVYPKALKAFGAKTVGRNIVKTGFTNEKVATQQQIQESHDRMVGWLNPPAPVQVVSRSTPTSTPTATTSSGGCGGVTPYSGGGQCWAIPYDIVQCESGGQNVPNSSGSGANGYYQLMSGGYGSKAQQDQAASQLWNGGAGRSNWVC